MLKVAVVDDEKLMSTQIRKLILEINDTCRVDTYTSGEDLISSNKSYDVIYLDIQMEGLSGIETARIIRNENKNVIIIFVTEIKEYVFEAFDVAAFHYLLKPINEEKFVEVFHKAIDVMKNNNSDSKHQLFIKTRQRNITIDYKDIFYVESRGRKLDIYISNDVIEITSTMNEMESQLGIGFYRCHRGYLVNMSHIAEYKSDTIILDNGESIILAKERYNDFIKAYMKYLKNGEQSYV